jgi:hypothetical protein
MNNIDVQTYDNIIPEKLQQDVWDYINKQKWHATWKQIDSKMHEYIPANVPSTFIPGTNNRLPSMWMHRTCFASDDHSLERDHPIIWDLWCKINNQLGNRYSITGNSLSGGLFKKFAIGSLSNGSALVSNVGITWRTVAVEFSFSLSASSLS